VNRSDTLDRGCGYEDRENVVTGLSISFFGPEGSFPGSSGLGEPNGGGQGETPRRGQEGENPRGVREDGGTQARGRGLGQVQRENTVILAC